MPRATVPEGDLSGPRPRRRALRTAVRGALLGAVHAVIASAMLAGCAGEGGRGPAVRIDTLPGGIPRTISQRPTTPGTLALEPLVEIQPPTDDPAEILNPQSIALADDGSVLLSESGLGQIKVFGPDGNFQHSFGRRGSGPNEYQAAFIAVRGDTLLVQDPQGSRFSRVRWRTGELIDQVVSVCCYWTSIHVDAAGYAWVHSIGRAPDTTFTHAQGFLRIPVTAGPIDTLWAYERRGLPKPPFWEIRQGDRMQMSMAVPFQPRALFTADPAGRLLTGWTGEYSIRETRDGRDTVALFGRAWTPDPVLPAEKQRLVDARIARQLEGRGPIDEATYRRAMDPALIPDQRPAYVLLHVDRSGRRWIELEVPDSSVKRFDVFSREGRWLDVVDVPRALWPAEGYRTAWGRDRVAVAAEDADGRPLIRVFAIRTR